MNLQRFCAVEGIDERRHLWKPWRDGQWTYATNGHICVRVPATEPDVSDKTAKHPNAAALFDKWLDGQTGEFVVVPPLPPANVCPICEGACAHTASQCKDCNGMGEFKHGDHTYECQNCDVLAVGSGWVKDDRSTTTRPCENCLGRGFDMTRHELQGVILELGYLHWLAELPQLRMRASTEQDDGKTPPTVFIFDGGQALLMPRYR